MQWPPRSLAEARALRDELVAQSTTFDEALIKLNTKMDEITPDGRQGGSQNDVNRRRWLITQKRHVEGQLRKIRDWIHTETLSQAQRAAGVSPLDDEALLRKACDLLKTLMAEDVDFDPEEVAFVDVLQARVVGKFPPSLALEDYRRISTALNYSLNHGQIPPNRRGRYERTSRRVEALLRHYENSSTEKR